MTAREMTAWGIGSDRADDWRDRSRCRNEDPELFFPIGIGAPAVAQAADAKAVCRLCPVAADCLRAALAEPGTAGVWGGTTEAERAELIATSKTFRSHNSFKAECPQGHPYDDDNTLFGSRGERRCRACAREQHRKLTERRREERQSATAVAG
jgi:WhiB family redox-sensing transcriptional regulator